MFPAPPALAHPFSVALTVSAPLHVPFVVSGGVPFPRGALTSLDHLILDDGSNQAIPAQFRALAAWPDASIKSVLVTAILPPNTPGLRLREILDQTVPPPPTPLACDSSDKAITISTGPMTLRFDPHHFRLFDQVNLQGTDLLQQPGDIILTDAKDGTEYRASRFDAPHYEVEECGPIRATLHVTGQLTSADGRHLTEFRVWIHAYAQQDYVDMEYTLTDPRPERDVNTRKDRALEVTGYGLSLPVKASTYAFGGDVGKEYDGSVTTEHYLYQGGTFHYSDGGLKPFDFSYEGVGVGRKAPGWLTTDRASVYLRDFWQQFPKEFSVSPSGIMIWLHPPRASKEPSRYGPHEYTRPQTFYFSREGGAKTYELLIQFHNGPTSAGVLNGPFQSRPRLVASSTWYADSGAFGHLWPAGPETSGYDTQLIEGIYKPSIECCTDSGSYAVLYGWRDYGDRLRPGWIGESNGVKIPSFYNDTHVGAHVFLVQYLRTLDARWWDLGQIATRHWMDIDVSHTSRSGYWKTKQSPGPGEAYVIKHEMADHDCRNLHPGHAHLSGLPDYYFLTGDPRALEVIREVGNWWAAMVPTLYPVPTPDPHYAEAERDFGWPLFVLNEAYRATGDIKYLQASAYLVKHLIGWWQIPMDHFVNGKRVGRNDWRQGTGWWTMNPSCDNSPKPPRGQTLYNGTNPWMAGALLSAVIQFSEENKDAHLVDQSLVREMLLQTMNYVVKYGWETKLKNYPYFVYCEAGRETDGGMNSLLFPLAYLGRLVRVAHLEHPEWYDTSSKWLAIADGAYQSWKTFTWSGSTSLGFYGYETVFPSDYFSLMQATEQRR